MNTQLLLRFFLLLITIIALCAALYLQHALAYSPCALCVLQRYVYFGALFILLLSFIPLFSALIARIILLILSSIGVALSAYHIWILNYPSIACGRDILEDKLNSLILAHWLPGIFEASGFCFEKNNSLLGLALPIWSLIGMLAIFCITLIQIFYSVSRKKF